VSRVRDRARRLVDVVEHELVTPIGCARLAEASLAIPPIRRRSSARDAVYQQGTACHG